MRHVTFKLGIGMSSSSAQSHLSESSELSQVPSFVMPLPPSESPPPPSESLPPLSESGTDSESQSGAELEDHNLTSSGSDSGSVRRCGTKYRHRAIPSPRTRRHINHIAHVGPAGNKRRNKALDVWSFFLPEEGENICVFCKYVVTLSSPHIKLIGLVRELHAANKNHRVSHFSARTATGPLRSHLFLHHRDSWIKTCRKLGIEIKSSAIQGIINEDGIIEDGGCPRRPFSSENFVDALVELIVGDDLVRVISLIM